MLVQIVLLLAAIVVAFLLFKAVKNIFVLALNSVVGLFALYGFNFLFNTQVVINFWSIVITAIAGIFGFIFILIAYSMGWAFI